MLKKPFLFLCIFLTACVSQHHDERDHLIQAAKINTQLGLAYLQENNFSRAKEKLLQAEKEAPDSPEVFIAFAYFYQVTHNIELANLTYRQALKKSPDNPFVLNNYGVFLCQQHQYPLGIHYFLQSARQRENIHSASAYENAGLCALKMGDHAQAMRYFKLALSNDPSQSLSRLELEKHMV